jgi:hypothetical protein
MHASRLVSVFECCLERRLISSARTVDNARISQFQVLTTPQARDLLFWSAPALAHGPPSLAFLVPVYAPGSRTLPTILPLYSYIPPSYEI